jgi:co-chaperonin GroES (HSP10)
MLQPLKNKLILQLIEKEKLSDGGIVLVQADREEANKGLVIAIGEGVEDINANDIVLPDWNKAQKTKYEDQDYYIIHQDDIVAIFDNATL